MFDLRPILNWLSQINDSSWNTDTSRQDRFGVHKFTKAIFLKKADIFAKSIVNLYTSKLFYELRPLIKSSIFEKKIANALLTVLPAHKGIPEHVDSGFLLENCRRFHIPIITNELVIFTVNGESINMKAGYVYEINNLRKHSVINNSGKDRIHLIIDVEG